MTSNSLNDWSYGFITCLCFLLAFSWLIHAWCDACVFSSLSGVKYRCMGLFPLECDQRVAGSHRFVSVINIFDCLQVKSTSVFPRINQSLLLYSLYSLLPFSTSLALCASLLLLIVDCMLPLLHLVLARLSNSCNAIALLHPYASIASGSFTISLVSLELLYT